MAAPRTDTPGRDGRAKGTRRSSTQLARTGGLILLVALVTVFAVLNLEDVKVDWILGSGRAPLIVVIVLTLLVGVVLCYLAERLARRRRN